MSTLDVKFSAIRKIVETGIKGEKELFALSPTDFIYSIPSLTTEEFTELCKFREGLKNNDIFNYFFDSNLNTEQKEGYKK